MRRNSYKVIMKELIRYVVQLMMEKRVIDSGHLDPNLLQQLDNWIIMIKFTMKGLILNIKSIFNQVNLESFTKIITKLTKIQLKVIKMYNIRIV